MTSRASVLTPKQRHKLECALTEMSWAGWSNGYIFNLRAAAQRSVGNYECVLRLAGSDDWHTRRVILASIFGEKSELVALRGGE